MTATLYSGARRYGEETVDVLVDGETIAAIGEPGTLDVPADAERIDATGLVLLPGLVDLHTHLRQPGFESSETVLTGTRAAARGGFTTVFAMANTQPVQDTAGVVEAVEALGREAGYADVQPIGAVTVGLEGERLSELGAMASSRARVRVFSDDGKCVFDPLIMRRALEYVKTFGGVVAQHAQDPRLTEGAQMNEGALSAELGLGGWPGVAETSIIARDVLLAEHVSSRLHVCHVSKRESVEIVRWAKDRGIDVTAEVAPHHLILTEELVRGFDARFKVNPPLRTADDVEALRDALADGTIDIVATDHAPHPVDAKETEWDRAAMGMVGLESALRIVDTTMVAPVRLTWRDVARVLSETPARIGSADWAGRPLDAGEPADLVFYEPGDTREFTTDDLSGKSINSPFLGRELPGRVVHTVHRGTPTLRDGVLADPRAVAEAARFRTARSEDVRGA
ncbi:dihydroorotase [Pseudoclavibacter chungangensis]|uniref:Dihydroorotase n=1 Tax=Pseudoclavibacter chungangensis TaxID=587635 RepID=A0A7J5BWD2_9MICO|nr:dihydroorotase [Pseudoclavibacter chungangensis]KAB1657850.1 dihydroorotase [Pseudoclavibacter chungangensis]NYJ66550.1 dihydroorotase [Pseudoclavibacter chungangensis]